MQRRELIRAGAALALLGGTAPGVSQAEGPSHLWEGYDFGSGPPAPDRLNQGPFGIEQSEVWATIGSTSQSAAHIRNFGVGFVGYAWEEGGPALAVRRGQQKLEDAVETLAALPFNDVIYIRCDWRDVQSAPGRLDLAPVWQVSLDAAKRHGQRIAFRVQMSNPKPVPAGYRALPDFLLEKVPLVPIGPYPGRGDQMFEPRYDHPEFIKAFRELNELLAARFDSSGEVEFIDLMMYGWWGEGHTSGAGTPFNDYYTAEKTFVELTRIQFENFKRIPLAANTQPDGNHVGNNEVLDMTVRAGGWLRSDSIIHDEPIQIERLAHRPPWLAVVIEQGWARAHALDKIPVDAAGVSAKDKSMLHVLDLGANYWALWTEGENLRLYRERFPRAFEALEARMGHRVRPSWLWQRERWDRPELIIGFTNDGVAGAPGYLRVSVESRDGSYRASGCLDAGQPYGGKVRQAQFVLPEDMFGREVLIRGEIVTNGVARPYRWCCAQPLEPDGAYALQLKEKGKLVWGEVY
ncbi:hypothetical protein LLH00_09430 [bacterium]|nr:hypothetical protein [bacterium]